MIEQLTQLVKQFGGEAVINNPAVPNELNDKVLGETQNGIFDALKGIVAGGNADMLSGLFKGDNAKDGSNPVVDMIMKQVTGQLTNKTGLDSGAASGVAGAMVPKILGSLIGNAKDPNVKGFEVSDLIGSLMGGDKGGNSGMASKIGAMLLDQNGDGKLDLQDALAAISGGGKKTSNSGGGILGGLFGKLLGGK